MSTGGQHAGWDLARILGESTRRHIYDVLRGTAAPLTRDEVAARTSVNRRLAAFHLDRLAALGLVSVDYARPPGHVPGPGAGRPAKRYRAVPVQLDLTFPPRSYDLVARLLATGIARHPNDAVAGTLEAARHEGSSCGAQSAGRRASVKDRIARLCAGLSSVGYEPEADESRVRLGNCPFRSVADVAPDLVCAMNREFIAGFVDGSQAEPADVVLEPQPAPNCCVTIRVRPR